ncbi:apolipoprotein N-acyltransferase [Sphingomonas sp. RS2018]
MPILLPIILGAIAATGFAPLDLLPLTILAFAVWLKLVHDAPTRGRAMLTGWWFGVGHFTINNNWIQHAFDYQDRMPPVLGYGAVVGLALYLAIYPMLAAGVAWRLASPRSRGDATTPMGASFVLVAAAAWLTAEYLRATVFTGYAWNPIGTTWLAWPAIAGGARFVGVYALGALLIVAAGALALLLQRRWATFAGVAVVLTGLSVADHLRAPPPPPGPALVRVVQPNIEQRIHVTPESAADAVRRMVALSGRPGATPRLLLWPEGSVDPYLEDGYPPDWYWRGSPYLTRLAIARALGPRDIALVGGSSLAFDAQGEIVDAGNSVFVVTPEATLAGRYDKAHLVPGGEYLPMRSILQPLGLSRLVAGDVDFRDGPGPRTLAIPGFPAVGMQVCYEVIFSGQVVDPARRPAILFNPSNEAWFGSWGPVQFQAQARMRAIEEGLPVLRSTPNGVSAVIAADGRILAQIPRYKAAAIELPMPVAYPPTLFARAGNWMAVLTVALLLGLAVVSRRRR